MHLGFLRSRRPALHPPIAYRRIALALLALVVAGPLAAPAPSVGASDTPRTAAPVARDPRFGLNETARNGMSDPADTAGANFSRVTFWWSELQKHGPDEFDLFATDQDRQINEEVKRGRELAGLMLNTPGWASSDGTRNGVPKNLYLPWDHPDNYWGRFMRRTAEHYKGRVDSWIIWNEIDIASGQWNTWNGSLEDYIQLQKVAYRAIKAGNPRATVVPFGAAWWYDRGDTLARMLSLLAADPEAASHNHFFDVGNLHLYSRADDIPTIVTWYRQEMARYGMNKPIWIAEMNAIPYDDAVWPAEKVNFRASLDEQAAYIVQAFATYLGLNVQRVSVNRVIDGTDFEAGGEPFGMLRNDGSTRPAFQALQVVTRYFANTRDASYSSADRSGMARAVLEKDDERITVVWTMRPEALPVTVDAIAPRALRVDKYGATETIEAEAGVYRLTLAPATANSNAGDPNDYVVGGDPVILVESRNDDDMAARPLDVARRSRGR